MSAVVGKMGNLIGSFSQGSTPTTPPPATAAISRRRRRKRKGGGEERDGEGGDMEEVEELSPRRSDRVSGRFIIRDQIKLNMSMSKIYMVAAKGDVVH